jgi:16S rRNA (cytosine967-C5)-methyltransferase
MEEQMLRALCLCSEKPVFILGELKPEWNDIVTRPLTEKISYFHAQEGMKNIFPFQKELSREVDPAGFSLSLLQQPDLFLRIRPGRSEIVTGKLNKAGISFLPEGKEALRLSGQVSVEKILSMDEDVVVQDLNSQQVISLVENKWERNQKGEAWDCCAASGGKSILLHDHFPKLRLTVSDIRQSILHNLRNRFTRAGIGNYHSFVSDLSKKNPSSKKFDLIICDAPCSGSGTWGRTPEHLVFFQKEKIDQYAATQKKIASHALHQLKPGGYFLYVTCSVFTKENEELAGFLHQEGKAKLLSQQYFKGYGKRADTMYAAVFEGDEG